MNLVNELQVSAEQDEVPTVLRKAKRTAMKLGVGDIGRWLQCEIDGYDDEDVVPSYRYVTCEVGLPTNFPLVLGDMLAQPGFRTLPLPSVSLPIRWRINEVVSVVNEARGQAGRICLPVEGEEILQLLRTTLPPQAARQVTFVYSANITQVWAIQDAVKDNVLEWARGLEQRGVCGECMSFSDREKEQAQSLHPDARDCTFHIYGGNKGRGKVSDNRGGHFTQARDVTDSFNTATAGAANAEVVNLLKQLAESINGILAQLPTDQQGSVANDYASFAKAAGKTPRAGALNALKDGLIATLKVGWAATVPVMTPLLTAVIKAAVGV